MEDMFDVSGDVPTFDDDDSMFGFGSTQMRSRAYTWPSRPPDSTLLGERPNFSPGDATEVSPDVMQTNDGNHSSGDAPLSPDGSNANRKTSSRRNAWGSMSYADLITRAIESSPEKRLTLSQIYAWMVANVPFFHDKGDSNSSAGWKNSIRHNLSLHSRFMRVQNEGTGKSSWWMVNTEASSSKMPRKRAGTMDATSGYRRPTKPGKRLPGVLKHARSTELHGAGNGSVCEDLPDSGLPTLGTNVDPIRFGSPRMRASSGNSSNSGCSPAALGTPQEPDSSGACFGIPPSWDVFPKHETLSESLADIFISDVDNGIANQTQVPPPMYSPMLQQQQQQPVFMSGGDAYARGRHTTPPQYVTTTGQQQPPILIQQPQQQQQHDPSSYNQFNAPSVNSNFPILAGIAPTDHVPTLGELLQDQRPGAGYHLHSYLTSGGSMSTQLTGNTAVNWQSPGVSETATGLRAPELQSPQLSQSSPDTTPLRRPFQINQRLLMQLLATKPHLATRLQQLIEAKRRQLTSAQQMQMTAPHQPGMPPSGRPAGAPTMLQQLLTGSSLSSVAPTQQAAPPQMSTVNTAPQQQPQPVGFDDGSCISDDLFPPDLDLTLLDQISTADINCDIDEVIQHELAFGDKLDFSFDQLHLEEFGADFSN